MGEHVGSAQPETDLSAVGIEGRLLIIFLYSLIVEIYSLGPVMLLEGSIALFLESHGFFFIFVGHGGMPRAAIRGGAREKGFGGGRGEKGIWEREKRAEAKKDSSRRCSPPVDCMADAHGIPKIGGPRDVPTV
jgi:hypothetical protein